MWRGVLLRTSSRGGDTAIVNFAGFMVYDEKCGEKLRVVLRGVIAAKRGSRADGKAGEELCGVEPYYLIRCQWSKRPLPP